MLKDRSYAEIYNDLDREVVNVFQVLRDLATAERLKELLQLTPFSRAEFEDAYRKSKDTVEQARKTIIKSFCGFGSNSIHERSANCGMRTRASTWRPPTGFRANSNRSGTTPAHDWQNYPQSIQAFCTRLQGVVIENRPAIEILRQHDGEETLHFVDPPYLSSTRTSGKRYLHEMTDLDHEELAEVLRSLKGMVVLSGYSSDLYGGLYRDWNRFERAHLADGALPRTEVVWINKAAYEARSQKSLMEMA